MTKYKINVQKTVLSYIVQNCNGEIPYVVNSSNIKYKIPEDSGNNIYIYMYICIYVYIYTYIYIYDLHEGAIKISCLGRLNIVKI